MSLKDTISFNLDFFFTFCVKQHISYRFFFHPVVLTSNFLLYLSCIPLRQCIECVKPKTPIFLFSFASPTHLLMQTAVKAFLMSIFSGTGHRRSKERPSGSERGNFSVSEYKEKTGMTTQKTAHAFGII